MKSPPRLLRQLTKPRRLLNCLVDVRIAAQKRRVLIRLPKPLAMLASLMLAVFAVSAGAGAAAAHGNHSHQISANSSAPASSSQTAEVTADSNLQMAQAHAPINKGAPLQCPDRGKPDGCCGSIVCHAGVTLTVDLFPFPCPIGARAIAERSSGRPLRKASSLERPPRSLDIA